MSQTLSVSNLLLVPSGAIGGIHHCGCIRNKVWWQCDWTARQPFRHYSGVLFAFVVSVMTLKAVALDGARFNETIYTWMVVGDLKMEIGFLVDGLTAMMMCVVTFVSLMVHLYTIGYMEEDEGYNRFLFLYLVVHVFNADAGHEQQHAPVVFRLGSCWLVSYLLIGFWFNKPTAIFANMKAFLVNRVGDFGFILGIGLIALMLVP
jgi:NADH-quinone oxidoreductase subunit L